MLKKPLNDFKGSAGPKTIVALVILCIFTVFILQNTNIVEISFLFWKARLSRVALLLGSFFIGTIIGFLIGWEISVKKKKY